MNEQMLKEVLEDVLEELRESNRSLTDMRARLSAVEGNVAGFDQKLNDKQVLVQPSDLEPAIAVIREQGDALQTKMEAQVSALRQEVKTWIGWLSAVVERQPKSIVRQWRVCFYPESDHSGNYRFLVNWLFVGTFLVLMIGASYMLGHQYIERTTTVQTAMPAIPADTSGKVIPHPRSSAHGHHPGHPPGP